MNEHDLKRLFPNASASTIRRNQDSCAPSGAKPEPPVRNEPLAETPRKERHSTRYLIGITSYRLRSLDPDNLAGGCKYAIDALRYSKLIPNDTANEIELSIRQEKVATKAEERTEIIIEPL